MSRSFAGERELDLAEGIIQNAQEGIVVTDAAGIIKMVNPAFTEITGYTPEEAWAGPSMLKSKHHGREFYESMCDPGRGRALAG
jgi:PAS domain S-box-containing protein